ncbi:MAG: tetratricopeptide repeat protein [Chloroflexi bacterium]|nr:tetratricopeptide repeat protein [Chloroflexota bacterium]
MGRPDEAGDVLERTVRIDEATYGSDHPGVASAVIELGMLLALQGNLDAGIGHLGRGLRIYLDFLPEGHPDIERTRQTLYQYRVRKIMRDEGVSEEQAIEILREQSDEE